MTNSDSEFVHIQPIHIAKVCRGLLQICKYFWTMGSDIDKKISEQGQEQERVGENDTRDHYGIDVGNDTRGESNYFYTSEKHSPSSCYCGNSSENLVSLI